MEWFTVRPLVFTWWNTGLSPPITRIKATSDDIKFVAEQIAMMRRDHRFTVLGLCEVQASDLNIIMEKVADPDLSLLDFSDRTGALKYDTALIYDRTVLTYIDKKSFVERFGKRAMKLGELAMFATSEEGQAIRVVVSHWPSRQTVSEHESRKAELGSLLRQSLNRLSAGEVDPHIVLMGDYNDDPFSPSLSGHLLATRDRELARRDSRFFYNPFWRCLGESRFTSTPADPSVCGTHYYANGNETEWFTYDQIIFSSAFLADGPITLDEEHTRILVSAELKGRIHSKSQTCDHLPVTSVATLRRKS